MHSYVDESSLVSLADSVELIWQHVGSRYQARILIADAIHTGELTVYAKNWYDIDEGIPTFEFEEIIQKATQFVKGDEMLEIGSDIWAMSALWPA